MKTKQTAIDIFKEQIIDIFEDYHDGIITLDEYIERINKATEQAKEMEREQMIEFAQEVFRNRYNQIHQSLGNIADDIYNETYGGSK
jgi:hypothetical protein